MTAGFYKVDGEDMLCARERLHTPTGVYLVAAHEQHTYPIDGGWRYFESEDEARAFFGVPEVEH